MPFAGDHRVVAIRSTLLRSAGMDVNVCNNGQIAVPANSPELAEIAAAEVDDSATEAVTVQVVIQDKVDDAGADAVLAAEQERPAFPGLVAPALPQTLQQSAPQAPRAGEFVLGRKHAAHGINH